MDRHPLLLSKSPEPRVMQELATALHESRLVLKKIENEQRNNWIFTTFKTDKAIKLANNALKLYKQYLKLYRV